MVCLFTHSVCYWTKLLCIFRSSACQLRRLHRVFAQCWRLHQRIVFLKKKKLCFRFSKSLKAIKSAMSKVRTIVCSSKYYHYYFRCKAKAPLRKALTGDYLALPLIFFNLLQWNLSKFSQFVKFVLLIIIDRGYKGSLFSNFVFSSSISNLVIWIFLINRH